MFNRRFLRVKILQALYAFFQSGQDNVTKSLKEVHFSIDRTFDLLLYLLTLPAELKNQGEHRIEEAKKKELPGEEDLNPNRKFVDNQVIQKLMSSERLEKLCNDRKISWSDQQDAIFRFYKQLRSSEVYQTYMSSGNSSYTEDRDMIISIYRELLPKFDLFRAHFQEKSIYWDEEDFDYASFLMVNMLKKTGAQKDIDPQLKPVFEDKEDKEFVDVLFKKTISGSEETEKQIIGKTENWDQDRIALIDMILMKMAITEIVNFSQIPTKVSMNEYIDISKSFSSPKSGQFINGIIDKVIADLKEKKKFRKMGRGLLE